MGKKNESDVEVVVRGNTAFALDLYEKLRKAEGNLFFSPYSISAALAMTYAGARGNTARQMARTLHFTLEQKRLHPAFASLETRLNAVQEQGNIQLRVANSLWPQIGYPFLEEFISLTEENYGASIIPVDYGDPEAARGKINTWVEKKTEDKIKELIPPRLITSVTTLVLVNAIYFEGDWASRFDRRATEEASFWVTPVEKIQVPMMAQRQKFRYAEYERLQVLELPYVGGDLSMIVLLPREVDGLAELENNLTMENLERWTSALQESEVLVFLPRFKMAWGARILNNELQSMGMTDAFDGSKADFSGMDGTRRLAISVVLHKAFIDVNEEGTEAAAATAVIITRGISSPPPTFRADHPFIFLIRDNNTGSILFIGRVVNPMAGVA
ncbi:MAG TPA: serpin family protein [Thermoflexia bacterium]|nr:serpin family protein [Thermoflexia bacterium]